MSLVIARCLSKIPARLFCTSATRLADVEGNPESIGLTREDIKKELLARLGGSHDPYSIVAVERNKTHAGTKEDPNLVPASFESRIIGCICSEDSNTVLWMWLHMNEPKKCTCGYWFKLYYKPPSSEYDKNPS